MTDHQTFAILLALGTLTLVAAIFRSEKRREAMHQRIEEMYFDDDE